jgi:hypothetical protein
VYLHLVLGTIACARAREDNVEQQRDAFITGRVLETVLNRQTVVYKAKENTDRFTSVGIIRPCGRPVHIRDFTEKKGTSFLIVNHNSWLKVYECNALL